MMQDCTEKAEPIGSRHASCEHVMLIGYHPIQPAQPAVSSQKSQTHVVEG
jgi:hypothetical protein